MKKFKNKKLISIIAGLSSIAIVVPLATSLTANAVNNDGSIKQVNDAANAASYVTITYKPDSDITAGWTSTIKGANQVRIRQGRSFGSAQKPTATHSEDWAFKGWSLNDHTETQEILADSDMITKNTVLYPVFEKPGVVISGPDTLRSTDSGSYTATLPGSSTEKVAWSLSNDWATKGKGTKPTINNAGKLTTYHDTVGTISIIATDLVSGVTASKDVTINAPYTNSSEIWALANISPTAEPTTKYDVWATLNVDQLRNIDSTIVTADLINTPLASPYNFNKDTFDGKTEQTLTINSMQLYVGDQVTSIPDNFMIGNPAETGGWSYSKVDVKFPETSKCTYIGKCFLQDCNKWNKTLVLPNTVKAIDDGFMYGCEAFNNGQTTTVGTFAIPSNIVNIGSDFLNGCKAFNQNLTIPASVTHVGDFFMTECQAMTSILTVNTPAESFDAYAPTSYTLATTDNTKPCYTSGVIIGGDYAVEFVERFLNREETEPYRKLFVNFQTVSWGCIGRYAEKYEAGEITAVEFCKKFTNNKAQITSLDGFIGLTRTVKVNDINHTVRVIGMNHDTIYSGTYKNKKALFTFDFVNVLSDAKGNALTCQWNSSDNATSYTTSVIYNNLCGTATWTGNINALTMITDPTTGTPELINYMKTVTKVVCQRDASWNYYAHTYRPTLFILTKNECNDLTGSQTGVTEGSKYGYYGNDSTRIKKYINNNNVPYWTASPYNSGAAKYIKTNGSGDSAIVDRFNYPMAPAFCI